MQNQSYDEMIRVNKMKEEMMRGLGGQLADSTAAPKKAKKATYGDFVP